MDNRSNLILKNSVRDFIKTGKLITSRCLYNRFSFGIKPAMIRRELNRLDRMGYFTQLHTSGGRIPTNKAYRYFVNCIMKDEDFACKVDSKVIGMAVKELVSGRHDDLTKMLSEHLKLLSVTYNSKSETIFKRGLGSLFEENEYFNESREIKKIVEDFEMISDRLEGVTDKWRSQEMWPRVFVGKSPITKSRHLSVIAGKFRVKQGDVFVINIGPKRMNYEKSLYLINSLSGLLD